VGPIKYTDGSPVVVAYAELYEDEPMSAGPVQARWGNADGYVRFVDLYPGEYFCRVSKDGRSIDFDITRYSDHHV